MATFTFEYWVDEDWYVGRLKEVPGVFSQGETLADLKENLRDAYHMLKEDQQPPTGAPVQTDQIQIGDSYLIL